MQCNAMMQILYNFKLRIQNLHKMHNVVHSILKNLVTSEETCLSHNSPLAARFGFVRHHITQFEIIPGNIIISFLYLSQIISLLYQKVNI